MTDENPKIEAIDTAQDPELSAEAKRALLARLLQKKANSPKIFPLSLGQQRLWIFEQLEPGTATYNISFAYHLVGTLNITVLEQSFAGIAQRHEALRTTFQLVEGKLLQVVSPTIDFHLNVIDLRLLPPGDRKTEAQRLTEQEAKDPFELTQESPLWRIKLLQLADAEYELLLTLHHIISDRASVGIVMQELASIYSALVKENSSPLETLPKQYSDYITWQQQEGQKERIELESEYWQQQLSNPLEPLSLPLNHPRSQALTSRGARQEIVLSPELTQALKNLSDQEGVSLFMTLLAAFKMLLLGYTGQEDLLVCSPVAGRHRSQTKGAIGYFNNILPLRTNLVGNPSFRELIGRVQQVAKAAYNHQEIPFQNIAELPHLTQIPLARTVFALQNIPTLTIQLPGMAASYRDLHNGTANFDLSLFMEEKDTTLVGMLDYRSDLFEATTIAQILTHWQILLEMIVAEPDRAIALLVASLSIQNPKAKTQKRNDQPQCKTALIPPRNQLEFQLIQIWEEVFDIQPIGIQDNFFDLGGHSVIAARLFAQIEQKFGKKLPLATLLQAPTIKQLAVSIQEQGGFKAWAILVALQTEGQKTPIFMCPGVFGNVLYFRELAQLIGSDQPFYGLQSHGLDGKSTPYSQLEEIATHHIEEIRSIQSHGPYYLGGHSFGAKLAFEIARQLIEAGETVALLALLDPEPFYISGFGRVLRNLNNLSQLGLKEKIAYLQKKLTWHLNRRILNPLQQTYGNSSKDGVIEPLYSPKVLEANLRASLNYIPKIYQGRVALFRATLLSSLQKSLGGWNQYVLGGIDIYDVPGDHHSLLKQPNIQVLAEKLRDCLQQAQDNF